MTTQRTTLSQSVAGIVGGIVLGGIVLVAFDYVSQRLGGAEAEGGTSADANAASVEVIRVEYV